MIRIGPSGCPDAMASTPRAADFAWATLARLLSFAKDRGKLTANTCKRGGRLSRGTRAAYIWSNRDLDALGAGAPRHMRLALLMGLWTGQRQGDLLGLSWGAYDGSAIRLRQSKTGTRVSIPVVAALRRELDSTPRLGQTILVNSRKHPWTKPASKSVGESSVRKPTSAARHFTTYEVRR